MSALILDAGALVALDRRDTRVEDLLARAQRTATPLRTSSAVVAQVWRSGPRQVRLARLLGSVDEVELTVDRSRQIGALLATSATVDVCDAALIDVAESGDTVLTSDPDDLRALARAAGVRLRLVRV